MKIHPIVRTSVQTASVGFAALASLACFIGDPEPTPEKCERIAELTEEGIEVLRRLLDKVP